MNIFNRKHTWELEIFKIYARLWIIGNTQRCEMHGDWPIFLDCNVPSTSKSHVRTRLTHRLTDGQTDSMSNRQTDRQTDTEPNCSMQGVTDWQTDRQNDWQTDRQTDTEPDCSTQGVTDWQTDRQTEWLTDRQTDWHRARLFDAGSNPSLYSLLIIHWLIPP